MCRADDGNRTRTVSLGTNRRHTHRPGRASTACRWSHFVTAEHRTVGPILGPERTSNRVAGSRAIASKSATAHMASSQAGLSPGRPVTVIAGSALSTHRWRYALSVAAVRRRRSAPARPVLEIAPRLILEPVRMWGRPFTSCGRTFPMLSGRRSAINRCATCSSVGRPAASTKSETFFGRLSGGPRYATLRSSKVDRRYVAGTAARTCALPGRAQRAHRSTPDARIRREDRFGTKPGD